jgi:hypothetical protein
LLLAACVLRLHLINALLTLLPFCLLLRGRLRFLSLALLTLLFLSQSQAKRN